MENKMVNISRMLLVSPPTMTVTGLRGKLSICLEAKVTSSYDSKIPGKLISIQKFKVIQTDQ